MLRWWRHIRGNNEAEAVIVFKNVYMERKKGRERLNKRWIEVLKSDMKMTEVSEEKKNE